MQHMSVNGKNDIWPSWYNKSKSSGITNETMTFDSISKKKATDCTPAETRVEVTVSKIIDPMTKKEHFYAGGYDTENEDDVHQCGDAKPSISIGNPQNGKVDITFKNGRYKLQNYTVTIDGKNMSGELSGATETKVFDCGEGAKNISVKVTDAAGYTASASKEANK